MTSDVRLLSRAGALGARHEAGRGTGLPPHRSAAALLLHGLCANPLELQPVGRVLKANGFTVAAPLIDGYGVAAGAPEGIGAQRFERWLDQAEAAYAQLAAQHDRVVVVGLCMGAVLSLALASRVRPAALSLISPTLFYDGWNVSPWRRLLPLAYLPGLRQHLRFAEKPPYGIKNDRLRRWVEDAMKTSGVSAAGAASIPADHLHQAWRLRRAVKARLGTLTLPVQILHATRDDVASPRTVHHLCRHLGTQPEVHWYDDSYHMLTLDNEREQVCAAVAGFSLLHATAGDATAAARDVLAA
jgi:carboxylesterase